jgi:predicted aconitase with swiveling domain
MTWRAQVLCAGEVEAEVLRLDAALSFWGGVSPVTSKVTLAGHPQEGQPTSGKILVIPQLIGSSSSSAVLLELIYNGHAPAGLILGAADAILPVGVLVARQMGWGGLPVLVMDEPPFKSGELLRFASNGGIFRQCRHTGSQDPDTEIKRQ